MKRQMRSGVLGCLVAITLISPLLYGESARESAVSALESRGNGRLYGHIVDMDGLPVAWLQVSVGDFETRTGRDGSFVLSGLEPGWARIRLHDPRYLDRRELVHVQRGLGTEVREYVLERGHLRSFDSAGAFEVVEGPIRVRFPAKAFVTKADVLAVSGMVDVELTPIDPSQKYALRASPAPLMGLNEEGWEVILQSYMMFHADLYGTHPVTGERVELELAPNQVASVSMRLPEGTDALPGETIPMWSTDPERNLWIIDDADALVVRNDDGSLGLETVLSHFSDWNADRPGTSIAMQGTLKSPNTFNASDKIYIQETTSTGEPALQQFGIYTTPAVGYTNRFYSMLPQCGMKRTTDEIGNPIENTETYFRILYERSIDWKTFELYGASIVNPSGETISYRTVVHDAKDPNTSSDDVLWHVYSASNVCDYLDGDAHGKENSFEKYDPQCRENSSTSGSKVNCDGSVCSSPDYLGYLDGGKNDYYFGDCSGFARWTNGRDTYGMKTSSGTESFEIYRIKFDSLSVGVEVL